MAERAASGATRPTSPPGQKRSRGIADARRRITPGRRRAGGATPAHRTPKHRSIGDAAGSPGGAGARGRPTPRSPSSFDPAVSAPLTWRGRAHAPPSSASLVRHFGDRCVACGRGITEWTAPPQSRLVHFNNASWLTTSRSAAAVGGVGPPRRLMARFTSRWGEGSRRWPRTGGRPARWPGHSQAWPGSRALVGGRCCSAHHVPEAGGCPLGEVVEETVGRSKAWPVLLALSGADDCHCCGNERR
jgi:hypothetical protein